MSAFELTKKLIRSCLQLDQDEPLSRDTVLLGGFPEFNSLTIVTLTMGIEESLDCEIDDDELSSEIFETVGTVADFIATRMERA